MNHSRITTIYSVLFILFLIGASPLPVLGQSKLMLSKNADFSTEDRSFDRTDVLYVKVYAPHINYTDIDDNEFRLKPDEWGNDVEHPLTNRLDGTYTTKVDLSTIDHREDDWEVRVEIEDNNDGEFEARRDITVGSNDGNAFDDDEIEFTGRVDSLHAGGITVDGVFFVVNDATQVLDDDNQPIATSDLSVGQLVEIRGDRLRDSVLVATKIKIEDDFSDDDGDDEVEFTGVINAISASSIEVAGVLFHVNSKTVVLDDNRTPISLSDLFIGQIVEIRGDRQGDGTLLATDIKVEDNVVGDDEVEFTGVVGSLNAHEIVVNDVRFIVNQHTVVLDDDNNPIDYFTLVSGLTVEIKGVRQGDGSLIAVRIKIEDRDDDEVELTGEIEQINSGSLVVAGLTFLVDDRTIILNDDKQPIQFSELSVGMFVEIRADVQPDGSLLASDIKIEDRLEDEVEVRGVVDSVSDSAMVVLGREFVVLPSTAVVDNDNQSVGFSTIAAGDVVEVNASLLPGGILIAVQIEREDDDPFKVRVQGPVDAVGPDTLNVAGIYLLITGSPTVTDTDGNPASLSDLAPGQTVDVDARGQAAGLPVVTSIRIKRVARITGAISNVDGNSIKVAGAAILIDNQTRILGAQNESIVLTSLSNGQLASVRAELSADGYKARTIELLKNNVASVHVEGEGSVPKQFVLEQNYPNPFNPTTTISFEVLDVNQSAVSLTIYNTLGQSVRSLLANELVAGRYQVEWDGRNDSGQQLASGLYLYQLRVNNQVQSRTMVLMK